MAKNLGFLGTKRLLSVPTKPVSFYPGFGKPTSTSLYVCKLQITEKMSKIPSLSGRILKKINNDIITFLHPCPCTPGVTVVSPTAENILESNNLIKLPEDKFLELFLEAREVAHILSDKLSVERCALVSYPEQEENLIEIKVSRYTFFVKSQL